MAHEYKFLKKEDGNYDGKDLDIKNAVFILKSPDEKEWKITIDNSGVLITEENV